MPKHPDPLRLSEHLQLQDVDPALLRRALTHRSSGSSLHMERLEFLGDAVLGLVIAEYLHARFPNDAEGKLSRLRAHLVRRESLLRIAKRWRLARFLHVGEGERDAQGALKSPSISANAVEAVIGAVFKSQGFEAARELILREWRELFEETHNGDLRDAKSRLQEWTQGHGQGLPSYQVTDLGGQSERRFSATCEVAGKVVGQGFGARKKQAEAQAAQAAIKTLGIPS